MSSQLPHICVSICTFKRQKYLRILLGKLKQQKTNNMFTYSIVVVDNDYAKSGEEVTRSILNGDKINVNYIVEPVANISRARNCAVRNAVGNYIAFIDDDEYPVEGWLYELYSTIIKYDVDGVLGPVQSKFEVEPPDWIVKGKILERPSYKTGTVLHWNQTRTGNVLMKRSIISNECPFDLSYGITGGEDTVFFKRMIENGYKFCWSEEAIVYENIPLQRTRRIYLLKRALLRGSGTAKMGYITLYQLGKSITAFMMYFVALPFMLIGGQHLFMGYLIKIFDHIGYICGCFGLYLVKERTNLFLLFLL